MAIKVLDEYYLGITAIITVAYQLFFFTIAFTFQFDKLTDFAGGTNFALLALVTTILGASASADEPPTPHARQIVAASLLALWSLRLAGFLLYRIFKTGKDDRFDEMRHRFFAFLGFWIFQMLWVWIVSLPVTMLNSPAVLAYPQPPFGTSRDIAGVVMFGVGFLIEAVADVQKFRFRSRRTDPDMFCGSGLWKYSRHPNYFGDIFIQFALYTIATSPTTSRLLPASAKAALNASVLGPIFITLLLFFLSGLPLTERPVSQKRYLRDPDGPAWRAYSTYLTRTSILLPFPPALYARMPTVLKRTIFLEFPMYVFDPAKQGVAKSAGKTTDTDTGRPASSGSGAGREGPVETAGSRET